MDHCRYMKLSRGVNNNLTKMITFQWTIWFHNKFETIGSKVHCFEFGPRATLQLILENFQSQLYLLQPFRTKTKRLPFLFTEKRSEEENSFHRGVGWRPENNHNENMTCHGLCCNTCWLGIITSISLTWLHVNDKVSHVVYRGMRNMWRGPTKKIHDVDNLILYYKRTLKKARRQKNQNS